MVIFTNFQFTGKEDRENGYLHMPTGWFRMMTPKYSVHRSGILKKNINGK